MTVPSESPQQQGALYLFVRYYLPTIACPQVVTHLSDHTPVSRVRAIQLQGTCLLAENLTYLLPQHVVYMHRLVYLKD